MSDKQGFTINFGPPMTLLTIVLIILKVMDIITISWWWVFSPLWLPLAIVIGVMLILLLIIVFARAIIGLLDR